MFGRDFLLFVLAGYIVVSTTEFFFLNLLSLINDVNLVLGSIATHHTKLDKAERRVILAWRVANSLQGQQVVGLSLFSTWKTGESNIDNIEIERDSLLLLQEDMVICKMNVARQGSINQQG